MGKGSRAGPNALAPAGPGPSPRRPAGHRLPDGLRYTADRFDRDQDFSQADGDRIDLSGFRGALTRRGERGFPEDGNEVRFEQKQGDTFVLADPNGDR